MKKIRIEVPMLPPRELTGNASRGQHWSVKNKVKNIWQSAVWNKGLEHRDAMFPKARLTITCVIRDRRSIKDTDNVLAACKPAIDMLTARVRGANPGRGDPGRQGLCIVPDDRPDILEILTPVRWEVDRARAPLTVFEIEEDE